MHVELFPRIQTQVIISVYVVPMHPRVVIKLGSVTVVLDNYFMPHNICILIIPPPLP